MSSALFQIPVGERYRLYQDPNWKGKSIDLIGTGEVIEVPDFKKIRMGKAVTSIHKDFKNRTQVNFGDEVTSSKRV